MILEVFSNLNDSMINMEYCIGDFPAQGYVIHPPQSFPRLSYCILSAFPDYHSITNNDSTVADWVNAVLCTLTRRTLVRCHLVGR